MSDAQLRATWEWFRNNAGAAPFSHERLAQLTSAADRRGLDLPNDAAGVGVLD